jgi:tetratricopeptide (TPR) repeat protein
MVLIGRMVKALSLSSCLFLLAGCATSFTQRVDSPPGGHSSQVLYLQTVPPVAQKAYQCGPAALESVLRYWGQNGDADLIGKSLYKPGTRGVLNFSLTSYLRTRGLWTQTREGSNGTDLKQWLRQGIPPIVMLDTGTLWARTYHFVVLKGFNDASKIFYANTGEAETQSINYREFDRRWKKAGYWALISAPPEKVDWELDESQSVDLALIFEQKGNMPEAERRLTDVLIKNPDQSVAKFNLANMYSRSGRTEQAQAMYRDLLAQHPDRGEISNNLAWLYYEQGLTEQALSVITEAFQNGAQRNHDILDTAGLIYCKLGRTKESQDLFTEAEKKVPAGDEAALNLVREHMNDCK